MQEEQRLQLCGRIDPALCSKTAPRGRRSAPRYGEYAAETVQHCSSNGAELIRQAARQIEADVLIPREAEARSPGPFELCRKIEADKTAGKAPPVKARPYKRAASDAMAHVWFAKDGRHERSGFASAELSIAECCEKLGLTKAHRIELPEDETRPSADGTRTPSKFADSKDVVVEIRPNEAEQEGWAPGFYYLGELTSAAAREISRLRQVQRIHEETDALAEANMDEEIERSIREELGRVVARVEELRVHRYDRRQFDTWGGSSSVRADPPAPSSGEGE